MRVWYLILFVLSIPVLKAQDYSRDQKLGAEYSRQVERQIGLYQHDSLNWLVNAVGQKLVARLKNKPFEFHFFLADTEEPNAFALPGGYIYVSRGILPMLQTEDELAGIMAHEIIHVMEQHSVKQMKKSTLTGILQIPGNLINAITGTQIGNIINAPIGLATATYISKYSRGHESEADQFGIQLAASAGYNPEALAHALDRLTNVIEQLTGEAEKRNYFSDHPYTPSRVNDIRKAAPRFKVVNPAPLLASQETFVTKFDGLCFGHNPQQGVFQDTLFIHPDLKFAMVMPSSWRRINNPTAVAAIQEKGEGIVSLQVADGTKSPRQLASEIQEAAAKVSSLTSMHSSDTLIHGIPGHVVRLKSVNKNQVAYLDLLWLAYHGNVFQLAALATPDLRTAAFQSLGSFRAAQVDELQRVMLYEITIVRARQNETLAAIAKRSDNLLKQNITTLFNNTDPEKPLSQGKPVKIVKGKIYRPN
jgi:predicted Zn-dependent protease